jgi:thioredoxin 1
MNGKAPNYEPAGVPEVNEGNFETEVLRSETPALVAFGAGWSKPCQVLKSVLEELATRCAGTVRVLRVNVDDNPDLGLWYGIESIPTLLCFVEGKVRLRIVGTVSPDAVLVRLATLHTATPEGQN